MKIKAWIAAIAVTAASAASVSAATYNFDLVWNGSTLTPTSPATAMAGTTLSVGDNFVLTIRGEGNSFWTNISSSTDFPINPLYNSGGGVTYGSGVVKLSNDGVKVYEKIFANEFRCCAELGITSWSVPNSTVFDVAVLEYRLDSTNPNFSGVLSDQLFYAPFRGTTFTYDPTVTAVPLPAAGVGYLTIIGLGAAFAARRRKRAA